VRNPVRVSVLVVAALVAAISIGAPSAAAAVTTPVTPSGSVGIRLLDVPVDAAEDARAKQYIVDNLAPGSTIKRRIEVSNSTSAALDVKVYPDAAVIKGGAFIGKAGHTPNELTTWTSLRRARIVVPAGGTVIDTVTVAIPSDAAPGERYAVVWAEVSGTTGGVITEVNRTGIRMYLSVGGNNPPPTTFSIDTLTAGRNGEGRALVLAQVHNTGGRAIDLSGTLSMTKISGAVKVGPYPVTVGTTLAPGQSEPVTIAIPDQIVNGPWNATIVLKSGPIAEKAHSQITFPKTAGTSPPAVTNNDLTFAILICVGIAIAVLGTVVLILRGRRKRKHGTA
jgi:hypothetical protein